MQKHLCCPSLNCVLNLCLSFLCRSVAVIKSSKDTRYGLDSIVTHDGAKFPCLALKDLSSFKETFGINAYDQVLQRKSIS